MQNTVLQQKQLPSPWDFSLHAGLLLLRGAALFLALTFGLQKFRGMLAFHSTGQPWSSWGFAMFLRAMGFPAPVLLSFCVVFNEWILALAVAAGFFTRFCSACVAVHMAIAFYVSTKLVEEPMRAALYFLIFMTLAIAGPGNFSIDYFRRAKPERQPAVTE